MYHKITLILLTLIAAITVNAQTLEDALRMSLRDYYSSARVVGTGSAMGAIGGDYGAVNINPANIGTFRNSYFTASLGMNTITTTSTWKGNKISDKNTNSTIILPNLGFVFSKPAQGKWETINFAIGFNRVRSNSSYINTSSNDNGSIVQRWAYLANEIINPDEFDEFELGPAFDSYALGQGVDDDGNIFYYSDYGNKDVLYKEVYEEINGGINEIALTLGGNYDNKLLLGVNISMPIYNNNVEYTYIESDEEEGNVYESVLFEDNYSTSGIGFNFGLGAIFMPTYKLRFGLSFESPTWFGLNENYNTRVKFEYYDPDHEYVPEDYGSTDIESEPGVFEYAFTTPWRVGFQAGWIIKKNGFIDVDIEYVNYASGKFSIDGYQLTEKTQNEIISDALGSALSIRTGGEIALEEFRIRLGAGFQQDPYENSDKYYIIYSGGVGFRGQSFYIDLAYRYRQVQGTFYPYLSLGGDYQPVINNTFHKNNFIMTVGFDL